MEPSPREESEKRTGGIKGGERFREKQLQIIQRCEMHGSPRIITSVRHGCRSPLGRWVEGRENLGTAKLLRERNVRDRGVPKRDLWKRGRQVAMGKEKKKSKEGKERNYRDRGKGNGQIIISGLGWIPEQLAAPLERANSLNLIIGRASLFPLSGDVVLRTCLVKLFFLYRKAADGKRWERFFFLTTGAQAVVPSVRRFLSVLYQFKIR